jgi:predicted SnoaL-like aldol condensation-catalyzing enzyme
MIILCWWLAKVISERAINAFYDLFRVENGKIAEHWDVIEPIPAR